MKKESRGYNRNRRGYLPEIRTPTTLKANIAGSPPVQVATEIDRTTARERRQNETRETLWGKTTTPSRIAVKGKFLGLEQPTTVFPTKQ